MDWPAFIVEESKDVAPYLLGGFGLFLFRSQLGGLILLLQRIRWSRNDGLSIDFGQKVDATRDEAVAAGLRPDQVILNQADADHEGRMVGLFTAQPELGIGMYWSEVERAIIELGSKWDITHKPASEVATDLLGLGVIAASDVSLLAQLRSLRNDVIHGRVRTRPTRGELLEYRNLALGLAEKFREVAW